MYTSSLYPGIRICPCLQRRIVFDWELKLGFLIHDVSRLRRSAFDRCLKPMNVTRSQWWVLAYRRTSHARMA